MCDHIIKNTETQTLLQINGCAAYTILLEEGKKQKRDAMKGG